MSPNEHKFALRFIKPCWNASPATDLGPVGSMTTPYWKHFVKQAHASYKRFLNERPPARRIKPHTLYLLGCPAYVVECMSYADESGRAFVRMIPGMADSARWIETGALREMNANAYDQMISDRCLIANIYPESERPENRSS